MRKNILIFLSSAVLGLSIYFSSVTRTNAQVVNLWEQETSLPYSLAHHTAHIYNNRIYILDGSGGPVKHSNVLMSEITPNGINLWQSISNTPRPLLFHSSLLVGNTIYVLGGSVDGPNNSQTNVYFASINPDGSLSSWAETSPLPLPISESQVFEFDGSIYLMGGATWINGRLQGYHDQIYKAEILTDGNLNSWQVISLLPEPIMAFSHYLQGNNIVVLGGATNSTSSSNKIYKTTILSDGTINNWGRLPDLPFNSRRPGFL